MRKLKIAQLIDKMLLGDALEVLAAMPDECIDLMVIYYEMH